MTQLYRSCAYAQRAHPFPRNSPLCSKNTLMCTSNPRPIAGYLLDTTSWHNVVLILMPLPSRWFAVGQRALLDAEVVVCAVQQRSALHLIPYVGRGFGDYRAGATHDFAVLNKRCGLAAFCGRNQIEASEVGRRRPIRLVARDVIESKTCASVWTAVSYEFLPKLRSGEDF